MLLFNSSGSVADGRLDNIHDDDYDSDDDHDENG
jgi:hypothetical protein